MDKYPRINDLLPKAKRRLPHFSAEYLFSGTGYDNAINNKVLNELEKVLTIKNFIQKKNEGLLKDKSFLVTGKLNGISRAEVKSLIEENSGKTVSSVSNKLNFLIVGDKPTRRKIENAKELKINIIDQNEFLKMLNKTS